MRRRFEILLLLAGLVGVGIWIWSTVRLSVSQKEANKVLEHKLAERTPSAPALPQFENGALIGRLVIPRLNLRAAVREGAGETTLDVALGHIPGTAFPGGRGNVGIAGHRDTLFRGLRHIAKDDVIQLQTPAGDYAYQVEDTSIVKPTDVGVLAAGTHSELTLVTCYPFYYVGPAPDRFIVKARLLTPDAAPPPKVTRVVATRPPPPIQPVSKAAVKPPRKPTIGSGIGTPAGRVHFEVSARHSAQVAPGILMGVSWTDARRRRANGWLWISSDRRTIWLRDQAVNQPILFRRAVDGKARELMITSVTNSSVAGYLAQLP